MKQLQILRNKNWQKTPKGKKYHAGVHAKRHRQLGYEPLNEYVSGYEGHHINNKQVVYIPKQLHRKYPHNHKNPKTMIEINRIAMQYLFNCKA